MAKAYSAENDENNAMRSRRGSSLSPRHRNRGPRGPSSRSTNSSSQGQVPSNHAENHEADSAQPRPGPSSSSRLLAAGPASPSSRSASSSAQEQAAGPSRRNKRKRDEVLETEAPCKVFVYMTPLESRAAKSPTAGRGDNPLPLGMQHWTVVFLWEERGFKVGGVTEKGRCTIVDRPLNYEEALDQPGEKVECGQHQLSLSKVQIEVNKMKRGKFTSTPNVAKTLLAKLGIELPVEGILFVAFKGLFDVFNFLVSKERRSSLGLVNVPEADAT